MTLEQTCKGEGKCIWRCNFRFWFHSLARLIGMQMQTQMQTDCCRRPPIDWCETHLSPTCMWLITDDVSEKVKINILQPKLTVMAPSQTVRQNGRSPHCMTENFASKLLQICVPTAETRACNSPFRHQPLFPWSYNVDNINQFNQKCFQFDCSYQCQFQKRAPKKVIGAPDWDWSVTQASILSSLLWLHC